MRHRGQPASAPRAACGGCAGTTFPMMRDRREALRPKGEETRQWFTTVARIVADFCSGVCFELRAYNIAASPSSASAKCPSSLALASNADITGGKIACGLGGRRGGFQFFQ
jgi:hypothetical protein